LSRTREMCAPSLTTANPKVASVRSTRGFGASTGNLDTLQIHDGLRDEGLEHR
jgi:hypothetical protein